MASKIYERAKVPLKLATLLHIMSNTLEIVPPTKGLFKYLLEALTVANLSYRLFFRSVSYKLVLMLLLSVRIRLGRQLHRQSLIRHLYEFVVLGKVGIRTPPMNPIHKFLRSILKYGLWQRHKLELQAWKDVGDIYCYLVPVKLSSSSLGTMICFVSDPELVEQVMTDKDTFPSRSPKGFVIEEKEGMLLFETGKKWALHRRIVTQFLTEKNLARFADESIRNQIHLMMNKWNRATGKVEVHHDLSVLTYEIITRFVAGGDLGGTENQNIAKEDFLISKAIDYVIKFGPILGALPQWLPLPMKYTLRSLIKQSDDLINEMIDKADDSQNSMLSAMKTARLENGNIALPHKELIDEVQTMFGAGHETTSNTLCWAMLLLAQHPEKLKKLQEEADSVISGDIATYNESKELKFATMVVYESLRLFPTVPSFPRTCVKDTRLGGYDIPAGSIVFVACGPLNQSVETWDSPEIFRPERFSKLPELRMSKPVGSPSGELYGYAPFGAGSRTCVGQRFALMEAVQILGSIAKNFTWSHDGGYVHEVADVTLGPKKGLRLDIKAR